jgi:hypothetical protein
MHRVPENSRYSIVNIDTCIDYPCACAAVLLAFFATTCAWGKDWRSIFGQVYLVVYVRVYSHFLLCAGVLPFPYTF